MTKAHPGCRALGGGPPLHRRLAAPAAALALVTLLASILGTEVDTDELEAAAGQHANQVDEAVAEHPDAGEMVAALEAHVDAGDRDRGPPHR